MAEPPVAPGFDWPLEQIRALWRTLAETDSSEEINKAIQAVVGMSHGTYWLDRDDAHNDFITNLKEIWTKTVGIVAGGVAGLANTSYGVPLNAGAVQAVGTGNAHVGTQKLAGDAIVNLIFSVFDVAAVASGNRTRLAGDAERNNFAKFVGVNWQLQIADILAGFVASALPWGIGDGMEKVGEGLQKMLGLEDAQEEILQPLMEKLITEGLIKQFNRDTKPTDLPPGDATAAFIRGYITEQMHNAILDNAGVMDDVRPAILKLRGANLTEADFRDLYQRGDWTRDNVFAAFRGNGYLEEDATAKTALVTGDRFWKLRNELLNVKESQFVAGVLDEGSFRNYLATMHFDSAEEDIEIEIAKGKASMKTATRPKQITGTFNVAPWKVKPGATAMMSWNIRNAETITISGIGNVEPRGERVISPTVSQTYVLTATSDTDSERFEAAVEVGGLAEAKRPTASFSASPGRITIGQPVELKWITGNADSVVIDGQGVVGESGALAVFPFVSTVFTLRATNAQGTTIRQDIVFVNLPDFDFDRERRPAISFTVTPGVVSPKQNQTEVTWRLTRAENGTMTLPDGTTRDVGRNGAFVFRATETGIFTLKASNLYGETQNQQAVIMKVVEEEAPPPPPEEQVPVLTLSVSPGTATPGESLSVFWNMIGATVGTLIFPDGTNRQVGASGSQTTLAPAVPGTYEFRLQATNQAGPSQQSVVVVVSATG